MQLGDELRAADSRHVQTGDDKPEIVGKLGLLHQAKCLGCVPHPLYIVESPLQNRLAQEGLEGIVIYQ